MVKRHVMKAVGHASAVKIFIYIKKKEKEKNRRKKKNSESPEVKDHVINSPECNNGQKEKRSGGCMNGPCCTRDTVLSP